MRASETTTSPESPRGETQPREEPVGRPVPRSPLDLAPREPRGAATALDRSLARLLVEAVGRSVAVVLWDGREVRLGQDPTTRVHIDDRAALLGLLLRPGLAFGDLYRDGRVHVEGDLVAGLERVYRAIQERRRSLRIPRWLPRRGRAPSLARSRHNIHRHYDLSNEFYALWLDRAAMQYTCAYYPEAGLTLEAAQRAKMEHVCRKVWLAPGERVIEAGCGWGGFALYMARQYGARVRAFNISHEQIRHARAWAAREGLGGLVEFVEDDYRNITGHCDVFVSVGMLEHVGPGNYEELGRVVDRCLTREGRGLIHSIGRDSAAPLNAWIRRRIFPGAYPPTLREMTRLFEPCGLSVLDVENLRLHYARTLEHWLERFERHADRVRDRFDERFVRAWRLYLAGSVAGFRTGSLQLFQVVFARTGGNRLPWSREHVYADLRRAGPA